MTSTRRASGFTLIEAVIAITITGILAAMVAVFIRGPIEGYVASERRASLTDTADTALRQISRELRTALPNSIRSISSTCFEFLPSVGGGSYRVEAGSGVDILDFTTADTSFDVIAQSNLPASFAPPTPTEHVVIYNLGIPGADAYSGNNRAQIGTTSTSGNIVLTTGLQFPFESPDNRFQIISNNSVVYSCSGGSLLRTTRTIQAAAVCPAGGAVLASKVSACSFNYTPVNLRNGQLTMTLVLTQSGESVQLYHEVHVNNTP